MQSDCMPGTPVDHTAVTVLSPDVGDLKGTLQRVVPVALKSTVSHHEVFGLHAS